MESVWRRDWDVYMPLCSSLVCLLLVKVPVCTVCKWEFYWFVSFEIRNKRGSVQNLWEHHNNSAVYKRPYLRCKCCIAKALWFVYTLKELMRIGLVCISWDWGRVHAWFWRQNERFVTLIVNAHRNRSSTVHCSCSLLQAILLGWPFSWIRKPVCACYIDPLEVSALTPFKRVYKHLFVNFTIGDRDRRFSVILQKWAWTQSCFKLNA